VPLVCPQTVELRTELDALAEAKNYYRWILRRFRPFLGKRVVEVGAGIGTFSKFLLEVGVDELILVEPAKNLFPILQQRFSGDPKVRVVHGYLENLADMGVTASGVDSIVLVNVLEHIEDDGRALKAAYRVLIPAGTLLLFVPALPWLYGTLDAAFGHARRYTKRSLSSKLTDAGFRILELRYFNLPGVISWFVAGKLLRRRTLQDRDVRLYDRWVVPWASRVEERWKPPVGQSLLAVGQKL